MHQWYYTKSGIVGDSQFGPIDEQEFVELITNGDIGPQTPINSPTRTQGTWIALENHPRLLELWQSSDAQRKAIREQEKQHRALAKSEQYLASQRAQMDRARQYASISDCTNTDLVESIAARARGILTSDEHIVYIAVREKPLVLSPDAMIATNKRLIMLVNKVLGRFSFYDMLWRDLHDAHVSQDLIGSTFSARHLIGGRVTMDYLNKEAALKLYRMCQEHEERAVEIRRQRHMEEMRASATQVQVNTINQPANSPAPSGDLVQRLAMLKSMLDQGLINTQEFEQRKREILSQV